MDDKTKSIVSHLFGIGWIIALVMNQNDKGEMTSFYLRQMLGILIFSILAWIPIPVLPFIIWIAAFILWVLSFIGALSGEKKLVPVVGDMFQQWFKGIS
ncbi:MAG TPA: hypothetical protein VGK46_06535 [Saprospiraceae bacterium]|jgi:uncharacterized membrane protein